ncbi:MAG: hypothetical protein D6723_15890 [Acidobacteria bacterium]|nr:MAG: hypothetical protein D6723_15890 [Acidobacteriota bacterium]
MIEYETSGPEPMNIGADRDAERSLMRCSDLSSRRANFLTLLNEPGGVKPRFRSLSGPVGAPGD